MNNHLVSCILNHASISKSQNSQITRSPGDRDPSLSDFRQFELSDRSPQSERDYRVSVSGAGYLR